MSGNNEGKMMQGRLIVMEGVDGSGKSTQYRCLRERLEREGIDFRSVAFPRYDQPSSALIREYLAGAYGDKPGDVDPYAASTFYTLDRFASFRTDWGAYYRGGGTVLCDRYTTSNACHQGGKLRGAERAAYLDWLSGFEYGLMGLPEPDLVLYLDVDIGTACRQLNARSGASDIHERDLGYLSACLEAGEYAAAHYGWRVVRCVRDGAMRAVEDIHEEIYKAVRGII